MMRFSAMPVYKLGGVALAMVLLNGCSTMAKMPVMNKVVGDDGIFRDHQADYLKAKTIPRTKVPAGLDSQVIDDLLVIPEIQAEGKQQAFLEPPMPRPMDTKADREVVIQRMDNKSWIIADASPSQVWPRIRDYWRKNNVQLASENPTVGMMETGWFVLAGNVETQEKFRVFVEPGFQDNSAEIRMVQIDAPISVPQKGPPQFGAQSKNRDTEFTVLSSLSSYLADVADLYTASSVSFLAGTISSNGKASLASTPGGSEVLQLKAEYERSWAAIGRAFKRIGLNVVAQDSASGIYDLVYVPGRDGVPDPKDESKGFFYNLWHLYGLWGDTKLPSYNIRVQVLKTKDSVEVLASPLGLPVKDPDAQAAGNSLLELLRNNLV